MGLQISKRKPFEQVLNYYVFQKKMDKYLNDWKNQMESGIIKIPDFMEENIWSIWTKTMKFSDSI